MLTAPYKKATVTDVSQGFHDGHKAIDIVPRKGLVFGRPLCAPEKVIITRVVGNGYTPGDTTSLEIGYGVSMEGQETGITHLYWHTMPYIPVKVGETVERGKIVAFMGNSGNVYSNGKYVPIEERTKSNKGLHLHYETTLNGQAVNPLFHIDFRRQPAWTTLDLIKASSKVLANMIKATK